MPRHTPLAQPMKEKSHSHVYPDLNTKTRTSGLVQIGLSKWCRSKRRLNLAQLRLVGKQLEVGLQRNLLGQTKIVSP